MATYPFSSLFSKIKRNYVVAGAAGLIALPVVITYVPQTVKASVSNFHPPKLDWYHRHRFHSLDHASIRRGFQVYKEVCASCHSMKLLVFHDFVNISHTEEELKAIANEYDIDDEPDDTGEVHKRPRGLLDGFPEPYDNEMQATYMNGGANPPDLSKIVNCREHQEDYLFSLLLGYVDTPEEITLKDGQYYNLYFPGNIIGMAPPLMDGQVEYEDGTPATLSQMAKDLAIFLRYTATVYWEDKEMLYIKGMVTLIPIAIAVYWNYRRFYNVFRTSKVAYKKFNWRK